MATIRSLGDGCRRLGALLDEMRDPALLWERGGARYRNCRLREMLADRPDEEAAEAAMVRLARDVVALHEPPGKSGRPFSPNVGARMIEIGGRRFLMHATWLVPGTVGPHASVVVQLRDESPGLPGVRALADRYRLTPRQAEVARLLAVGATNREISDRLGISIHTARHHAQSVLNKVGTHSRKALGIHFIEDARSGRS